MTRFKLIDEHNSEKEYVIEVDFQDAEDFDAFTWEDEDFESFMDDMECGKEDYCGVHDGVGGIDDDGVHWDGYHSYEIKDFDKAIDKWKEFFRSKGKLIE